MKKLLLGLVVLFAQPLYAGLITHTDYTAGNVITAAGQNANENAVFNEVNGNLDNTNIKADGITSANILDGTIIAADVADSTISLNKLATPLVSSFTVVYTSTTYLMSKLSQMFSYQRPNLVYASATTVTLSTNTVVFPDGDRRTDNTAGHTTLNVAQTGSLTGTVQSGLVTGSASNNNWYCVYAVKVPGNGTDFVLLANQVSPQYSNYGTLNTAFGAQSWVYLGSIAYGDNGSTANAILNFVQAGNETYFINNAIGSAGTLNGIVLANNGSASGGLTYTYASGFTISSNQTPPHILIGDVSGTAQSPGSGQMSLVSADSGAFYSATTVNSSAVCVIHKRIGLSRGALVSPPGTDVLSIFLTSFVDSALGISFGLGL